MKKEEKNQVIEELKAKLSNKVPFYIANIDSLNSEDTSKLRRMCFKQNIEMSVVKNSLLKKALEHTEGTDYSPLYGALKGNSCLMLTQTPNGPAKLIKEFRKKSDKPILKAAYVEESIYVGDDQLNMLAALKSKNELIGDIIGLLQSPLKNIMSGLKADKEKKEGNE